MKRCRFFISHKSRPCRFHVVPGKEYCGQHLYLATGEGERRIPCPLNPGHRVLEKDLHKHLKKCSAQLRMKEVQSEVTYALDVNRPNSDSPRLPSGDSRSKRRSQYAEGLGPEAILDLISKVEEKCCSFDQPSLKYYIPDACRPYLKPDGRRPFKLKHALQQASITGHLMEKEIFSGEGNPLIIEFGAGKAYLSSMISDCTKATHYVLVDNQAFKLKAERTMRSNAKLVVRRVRMDLKDFNLSKLPELQTEKAIPWVALGKHLCGGSTDYAMYAFQQAAKMGRDPEQSRGMFIATCCHHRCEWESFVAKENFTKHGFTKEEFELVSWMTGWALCDHRSAADVQVNEIATTDSMRLETRRICETEDGCFQSFWRHFPKEFRISVGMKCKRIIDICRMEWMQDQGFHTELSLYVPSDVSPENQFLSVTPGSLRR